MSRRMNIILNDAMTTNSQFGCWIEGVMDGIFGPLFAGLDPLISNCTLWTVERVQFLVQLVGKGAIPWWGPVPLPSISISTRTPV